MYSRFVALLRIQAIRMIWVMPWRTPDPDLHPDVASRRIVLILIIILILHFTSGMLSRAFTARLSMAVSYGSRYRPTTRTSSALAEGTGRGRSCPTTGGLPPGASVYSRAPRSDSLDSQGLGVYLSCTVGLGLGNSVSCTVGCLLTMILHLTRMQPFFQSVTCFFVAPPPARGWFVSFRRSIRGMGMGVDYRCIGLPWEWTG